MEREIHPLLKALIPFVDALGETFGADCEVALHDLSQPQHSIIKIANGHQTGRKEGDGIRDLVMTVLRSKDFKNDRLVNYLTKTKDGKMLKSSTVVLRDEAGDMIGALCINYNIGRHMMAQKLMEEFCQVTDLESMNLTGADDEPETDVINILKDIIHRTITQMGKPITTKEDKLEVVAFLDEKGVFLIKGAVEYLANELGVSRYTIYNYLEETRSNKLTGSN